MPMQSRTDQVHAYQFFLQRMTSGLVAREADPADVPFRRLGWAGFASFMLAAILIGGFGLYGLVAGGSNTAWQAGDTVVVDRESGAAYVYLDGRLHPVSGVVAGRLVLGAQADITRVAPASLADVPRGYALGPSGIPSVLPPADQLLTSPWSLCTPSPAGEHGAGPVSTLGIGHVPQGTEALPRASAVVVRDAYLGPSGDMDTEDRFHLIWRGHRFLLADLEPALRALGVSQNQALTVSTAWLETLPVGYNLRVPLPAHLGEPTETFGELEPDSDLFVGQIIEAAGAYYLVRIHELAQVSPLMADMILAHPRTVAAYPDRAPHARTDVPTGLIARSAVRPLGFHLETSPPEHRPDLAELHPDDLHDNAVCAVFTPGRFMPEIRGGRLAGEGAIGTAAVAEMGARLADQVLVAGGRASVVRGVPSPRHPEGPIYLVSDQGVRHALGSPDILGVVGYAPHQVVDLPVTLLARLPAGPSLLSDSIIPAEPDSVGQPKLEGDEAHEPNGSDGDEDVDMDMDMDDGPPMPSGGHG
jgi:type VII secretion protein EccB